MSIRRILVLLAKELVHGRSNLMFIFAIVMPVMITLLIWLLFGTVFSGKARLGLVAESPSQLVDQALALEGMMVKTYPSASALRDAVGNGEVDLGVVIPAGFDQQVSQGERTTLAVYVWGESTLKNRVIPSAALLALIRDLAGQETPVEIIASTLGAGENIPWEKRLLPFIMLMTIVLGGSMVPAASLVEEKEKRTLRALTTTPASLAEVFAAKGLLGAILAIVMAFVTLILNGALGQAPGLLLLALALGAIFAATIGILLGAFIKDINTLFTVVKGAGILLYAPAIVYLFPELPAWVGRIFPTYYMIQPVVEITQQGASFADVAPELAILVALILAMVAIIAALISRASRYEGSLNPA